MGSSRPFPDPSMVNEMRAQLCVRLVKFCTNVQTGAAAG